MTEPTESPRQCLVTGGTGFIGSHLVERLLTDGHAVRIACRTPGDLKWLDGVRGRVEVCEADLTDPAALEQAVAGCRWVFHVGGLTTAHDQAAFDAVNQAGTANLFRAAQRAAADTLERFVYVSSLSAGGPASDLQHPRSEDAAPSFYGRSKVRGEQSIRELAAADSRRDWPFVIVRPSVVYGPRGTDVLQFFRMIRARIRPTLGWPTIRLSTIHVDDLVDGLLAIARTPAERVAGETFNICHPVWHPLSAVMRTIQKHCHRSVVLPVRVPLWVVAVQAATSEWLCRRLGMTPSLTYDKYRELSGRYWIADTRKIQERTGWSARVSLDAGMAQTADWYRSQGWL